MASSSPQATQATDVQEKCMHANKGYGQLGLTHGGSQTIRRIPTMIVVPDEPNPRPQHLRRTSSYAIFPPFPGNQDQDQKHLRHNSSEATIRFDHQDTEMGEPSVGDKMNNDSFMDDSTLIIDMCTDSEKN